MAATSVNTNAAARTPPHSQPPIGMRSVSASNTPTGDDKKHVLHKKQRFWSP